MFYEILLTWSINIPAEIPGGSPTVLRVAKSCTNHTIPNLPVGVRGANAEYMGGSLYFCGGYIDEEGSGLSGNSINKC